MVEDEAVVELVDDEEVAAAAALEFLLRALK
jgi:hypothetical protein